MNAFIFDFNGTLVFDTPFHRQAWRQLLQEKTGRSVSDQEFFEHVNGRSNDTIVEHFFGAGMAPGQAEALGLEKEALYRQLCRAAGPAYHLVEGAGALFDRLQRLGAPFAIATSSEKTNADFYFEALGLGRWFGPDNFVYNDGTVPGKPAPDLYRLACARLGRPPTECVVFEDAPAGIRAARAAGVSTVIGVNRDAGEGRRLHQVFGIPVLHTYEGFDPQPYLGQGGGGGQ